MSRRRLVQGAAVLAAGATAGAGLLAPAAQAATAVNPADLTAGDPLLHLLRRATWGPSPASIAEIRKLGASAWLERQLRPTTIPDAECDALVARLPLTALSIGGVHSRVAAGKLRKYSWDVMFQVGFAATARAVWSNRQLFEVMVDFWSNHLNITCPAGEGWDSRQDYDRAVIRRYALGRFADLLKASARHPAMLSYLDNRHSHRRAPNENYARELLELHTVGLVYSEADVKNAARLLTGLTVSSSSGYYRYEASRHATGAVRILRFSHANRTQSGGEAAAMALLDYLAMHPATARRIAQKLCVRFVSDTPPAALVDRLAKVYLANRSAIAPVLRALFRSPEFAAARGAKVRTPLEDIVATVRILGYRPERVTSANPQGIKAIKALYWTADGAGQAPMAWAPPNGYPDVAAAWASPSGYLARWNAHLSITAGWWPDELVRPESLPDAMVPVLPATYGGLIDALARRLFGLNQLRAPHTAALCAFFGKAPGDPLRRRDAVVQWKFPYLVAMLLNSPYFTVR